MADTSPPSGPWHFTGEGTIVARKPRTTVIATVADSETGDRAANGRLIAAAPELYSALDLAFHHLDGQLQGGKSDAHGSETERIASECWAALQKARRG